jgi:hypothetical protein
MLMGLKGVFILSAFPIAYFIFSLFMLNREARFTKYQSQLFQVMFYWLLCCVLQVFITREFTPHSLIIFIPSLAYFISHYLLLIRRKWIAEIMLWIFMTGVLSVSLLARYQRIDDVRYGSLFPVKSVYDHQIVDKRVMVLAHDPGIYEKNQLAGAFLNWNLSKPILEHPEFYQHVITVAQSFQSDSPDIVIDPDRLLEKFFDHFPNGIPGYKRVGSLYQKIPQEKRGISN